MLALWIVVGATVGGVAAIAYSLNQATQVPDWYATQTQSSTTPDSAAPRPSLDREQEFDDEPGAVVLDRNQMQQIVGEWIADHDTRRTILERAEGFSTTIEEGRVKGGAVINLSRLPLDELGADERALVERAIAAIPGLDDRDVFIGIEGSPRIQDGRLNLGDGMVITVGRLSLPMSTVAGQLGISLEQLEQQINAELQSRGVDLSELEIQGDRILLRE